jgi:hypothetical protein
LLEPAPGPWGGAEIFDLHPADAWRRILDWLKSQGVDYLVAVVSPKFRDNIYHDWPFPYLCDHHAHPEARMFPPEVVRRNRDIVNRIVSLAAEGGIDVYLKQFNFYAPRGFIEAHPEIREKYRRTRGAGIAGHDSCNFMNTLFGNICWSDPVYRVFMKRCWSDLFEAVPGLKGLMVTPGEHNACTCPLCVGTNPDKDARRLAKTGMLMDFIRTFCEEMKRHGRESLVRTWYVQDYDGKRPMASAWFPKYHVFDCFDAPIDPQSAALADRLKEPVHFMFVHDGENAAQTLWFNPAYWRRIGQTLRARRADGAIVMHNMDWGMSGMTHPCARLNLEAFYHYIRHPDGALDQPWLDRLGGYFGASAAPSVLQALEKVSAFPMNVTKVIFLGGEGYTFGPVLPCDAAFAPDPWGVLARDWSPPDWARGDVGRLRIYWDHLETARFESFEVLSRLAESAGERCPLRVLEGVIADLESAAHLLDGLEPRAPESARGWLDTLIINARFTREHARMLLHSIRAALLIRAARVALSDAAPLAVEAVREHQAALDALKNQVAWLNAHPHDFIDYRNWLRLTPPPFNSYQAIQFTPLSLVEQEHANLRDWAAGVAGKAAVDAVPKTGLPSLSALPPASMTAPVWRKE